MNSNQKSRHSISRSPQFPRQDSYSRTGVSPLTKYPLEDIENRTSLIAKYQLSKLSLDKSATKLRRHTPSKCIDLTPQWMKTDACKSGQVQVPVKQMRALYQKIGHLKKHNIQLAQELNFLKNQAGCSNTVFKVLHQYQ